MFVNDTLRNLVSGMGTERDKLELGRFASRLIDRAELTALYENDWMAGKIIDAPVDDMTREWRQWHGGPKQVAALNAAEGQLKIRSQVNRAMKLARLFGGSALLLGTADANPALPLNLSTFKRGGLQHVQVLSRWEISCGPLDREVLSANFGAPAYYEVHSAAGRLVRLHPSRVIRLLGQSPLETTTSVDGWGLPTLQRVYDAVRSAAAVNSNLASLTFEAKVDVFGVPDLTARINDPNYRTAMLSRFSLVNLSKSINNSVLRDAAETWEQKQVSFSHFPEVMRVFLEIASGAADIPATRLLGVAPKGLNATGQSDIRNYYDMLAARQEVEVRPALHRLDEALCRHAGVPPAAVSFEWRPLWQVTEAEQAAIALQKAQTAQIYAVMGALPPSAMAKAVQAMLQADGTYPGLSEMLATAAAAEEAPAPLIAKADMVETAAPRTRPAKS